MSRGNVEITFDADDEDPSATSELDEYLLHHKRATANPVTGFFSNVGTGIQKIIPRRIGGTGSIEDDIAVRFGNLFGTGSTSTNGPTATSSVQNREGWFTLSRKDRIVGFFLLLGMGVLFFVLSSFYIPVIILFPRKFSIFFKMGSVFTFAGLSVLWGFSSFMRHLVSPERLPFTGMYLGSLAATLYCAIGLHSYVLTVIGIILQVVSLLSFIISYLPGGVTGMKYLGQMITSSMGRSLPI